jgi:hypothetical protein
VYRLCFIWRRPAGQRHRVSYMLQGSTRHGASCVGGYTGNSPVLEPTGSLSNGSSQSKPHQMNTSQCDELAATAGCKTRTVDTDTRRQRCRWHGGQPRNAETPINQHSTCLHVSVRMPCACKPTRLHDINQSADNSFSTATRSSCCELCPNVSKCQSDCRDCCCDRQAFPLVPKLHAAVGGEQLLAACTTPALPHNTFGSLQPNISSTISPS